MERTITQFGMWIHLADVQPAAARGKAELPPEVAVAAEVDVSTTHGQSLVRIRVSVSLAGIDRESTRRRIDVPHREHPHSNAALGGGDVALSSIGWSRGKEST